MEYGTFKDPRLATLQIGAVERVHALAQRDLHQFLNLNPSETLDMASKELEESEQPPGMCST